jgi:serine protease
VGVGRSNDREGIAGINWSVGIVPVRVLGYTGGTTIDINDGIRWAVGMPIEGLPKNAHPARIINMSLGAAIRCSEAPATQAAIDDAVAAGAIVVVAAGNDNEDASNYLPAGCKNVVAVAASDLRGGLASYSNYGQIVSILAPGGDRKRADDGDYDGGILSLVKGDYRTMMGTSMAAPHVAGVLALWLSHGEMKNAELLEALRRSAVPRTPRQCPQPCGAGLLNALGAPHVATAAAR